MAESLMDFGKVAQTMIAMGNLEETRRRNDLAERHSLLEMGNQQLHREQLQVEQQRLKQNAAFRLFDEIEKERKSPLFSFYPVGKQADIIEFQHRLLAANSEIPYEGPSRDESIGALQPRIDLNVAMRKHKADPTNDALRAEAEAQFYRYMIAAPEDGKRIAESLKAAGELSVQGEQLLLKLELNQAKLKELNVRAGREKLKQGLYTEHLGALNQTIRMADDPSLHEDFAKVISFEKPEAREAYLNLHPEFKQAFTKKTAEKRFALMSTMQQLRDTLAEKQSVMETLQAIHGQAPDEVVNEVKAYQAVLNARQAEADYLDDPFNKAKYKAVKAQEQIVKAQYGLTEKALSGIEQDRLNFAQSKYEDQQREKQAFSYAQDQFVNFVSQGYKDNEASSLAMKAANKKYPGAAIDSTKFKNLEKVGKQEVSIHLGQEDVTRNLKAIESAQGVLDFAHELRERVEANPGIIGKGAQIGTAVAGAGQQLRSIMGLDPSAAKMLNTKPRDEAEAFYEIMVYMQARSMDPSGPLDIKVVENARKVIGDINSFTTGPQQFMNKLDIVTKNAERNVRKARRHLSGGVQSYLTDENISKPVGELDDEQLLKRIMQGAGR